jgi:hypothetical protein
MKTLLRLGCVALIRLQHLGAQATAGPDGLLLVRAPRCAQPFTVGLIPIDGAEDESVQPLAAPDAVLRYAYLGTVEGRPRRTALTLRWGWAMLLFNLGLRPDRPPRQLVLVAAPRGCIGLDWGALSPAR